MSLERPIGEGQPNHVYNFGLTPKTESPRETSQSALSAQKTSQFALEQFSATSKASPPTVHYGPKSALMPHQDSQTIQKKNESTKTYFSEIKVQEQVKSATTILKSTYAEDQEAFEQAERAEETSASSGSDYGMEKEDLDQLHAEEKSVPEKKSPASTNVSDYEMDKARLDEELEEVSVNSDVEEDVVEDEHVYGPFINEMAPFKFSEKENVLLSLRDFRYYTSELHHTLKGDDVEKMYTYIMDRGGELLSRAEAEGKTVQLKIPGNHTVFATPEGKLYMELSTVGEGIYKTALKVSLIGSPNLESLERKVKKTKVISVDKKEAIDVQDKQQAIASKQEAKNEREINRALYELSKKKVDLSNVAVGKAVKVLDITSGVAKKGKNAFIAPFASGGSVDKLLGFATSNRLRKQLLKNMALGVSQLHANGFVHRDLKTDNFLVFKDSLGDIKSVKVADFGKTTYSDLEKSFKERVKLPIPWIAPEWLDTDNPRISTEGDIYQLGVTFYQVLSDTNIKNLPFRTDTLQELIKKVKGEPYEKNALKFWKPKQLVALEKIIEATDPKNLDVVFNNVRASPEIWPGMSKVEPALQKLIYSMLDADPAKRPTADQVVKTLQTL